MIMLSYKRRPTGITSTVVNPAVEAHNFDLKLATISLMVKDQFSRQLSENPNMHLHNFLVKCDTIKLNGVHTYGIRLRLFSFSSKDEAKDWL